MPKSEKTIASLIKSASELPSDSLEDKAPYIPTPEEIERMKWQIRIENGEPGGRDLTHGHHGDADARIARIGRTPYSRGDLRHVSRDR